MQKNPSPGRQKVLLVITALFWFSLYVYIPYQTPYLKALGISSAFIGVILGAYGATQMIVRIPLGVYADRKSRHRPFITAGTLLAALASLLRLLWPGGPAFFIANLFSGVAASTWISFTVLFSSYFPADRLSSATGRIFAANNIGTLVGFLAGTVATQLADTPVLFILSIGAGLLAALLSIWVAEGPAGSLPAGRPSVRELLSVCARRRLVFFSAAALLLQGVNMSTAMAFTNQHAADIGGSTLEVGVCSVCYMIACICGSLYAGSGAARRAGARKLLPVSVCAYGLYCALVPLTRTVWPLYPLQLLGGLSYALPFSLFMSCAVAGVPAEKRSTAMGFYQAVYGVGMTFVPMLAGVLLAAGGMGLAYGAMAAICALDAVLVIAAFAKKGFLEE